MPKAKRERRERTDNYHLLQQWCRTPEQRLYEGIRPVTFSAFRRQNGRKKPVWRKGAWVEPLMPLIHMA